MQPGAWRASPRRSGCGTTKDSILNVLSSLLCMSGSLTICFDSRMRAEQLTTTVPTSGAVFSGADMLGGQMYAAWPSHSSTHNYKPIARGELADGSFLHVNKNTELRS